MDYKNGKIYAIRSYQTDIIYIGSTCSPLSKRFYNHKYKYKQWKQGEYRYITSFEIFKYDDAYIELIELYPCNSKIELHKREGEYIRNMECVNKVIPNRTIKEWRKDNRNNIIEYHKQYRKQDKRKQYEKQYYEKNKDKMNKKMKIYRENNKEKISLRYKKTMDCICGSTFRIREKSKHYKTKKHRTYIFNLHNELNHL